MVTTEHWYYSFLALDERDSTGSKRVGANECLQVNTALQMMVIAGSVAAPALGFGGHPVLTCL